MKKGEIKMKDSVQFWFGTVEADEVRTIDGCSDHGKITYTDGVEYDFDCQAQNVLEVLDNLKQYIIDNKIIANRVSSIFLNWDSTESDLVL